MERRQRRDAVEAILSACSNLKSVGALGILSACSNLKSVEAILGMLVEEKWRHEAISWKFFKATYILHKKTCFLKPLIDIVSL